MSRVDWQSVWDNCISPDYSNFQGFEVSPKRYMVQMLGWSSWMFWPKTNVKVVTEIRGINKWFWKWGNYSLRDGDANRHALAYTTSLEHYKWCLALDYNIEDNSKLICKINDFIVMVPHDIEEKCPEFSWSNYSKYYDHPQNHVLYLGDFRYIFKKSRGHDHVAWFLLELIPEV